MLFIFEMSYKKPSVEGDADNTRCLSSGASKTLTYYNLHLLFGNRCLGNNVRSRSLLGSPFSVSKLKKKKMEKRREQNRWETFRDDVIDAKGNKRVGRKGYTKNSDPGYCAVVSALCPRCWFTTLLEGLFSSVLSLRSWRDAWAGERAAIFRRGRSPRGIRERRSREWNSTRLFTNPLTASPLALASLPKQKHACEIPPAT